MNVFIQKIAALFSRKTPAPKRDIFEYSDGERRRFCDPIATWRRLWTHQDINLADEFFIAHNAHATREDGTRIHTDAALFQAEERVRTLTCEIFGVKALSESQRGLTELELDDLLKTYLDYMTELRARIQASKQKPAADTVNA